MSNPDERTRVQRFIIRIQNHPIGSIVIILTLVVGGIAGLIGDAGKILDAASNYLNTQKQSDDLPANPVSTGTVTTTQPQAEPPKKDINITYTYKAGTAKQLLDRIKSEPKNYLDISMTPEKLTSHAPASKGGLHLKHPSLIDPWIPQSGWNLELTSSATRVDSDTWNAVFKDVNSNIRVNVSTSFDLSKSPPGSYFRVNGFITDFDTTTVFVINAKLESLPADP